MRANTVTCPPWAAAQRLGVGPRTAHLEAGGGDVTCPPVAPDKPSSASSCPSREATCGSPEPCSVLCAVRPGRVRALPGATGLKILFPSPRLMGRTPRSGRTSTLGEGREGRGGCGQQSLSTARTPRAERSRPAGLWRASGGNPHLDPPSVLSKRQCSLTTQYVK